MAEAIDQVSVEDLTEAMAKEPNEQVELTTKVLKELANVMVTTLVKVMVLEMGHHGGQIHALKMANKR